MKGKLRKTERGWIVSWLVGDGVKEVWDEHLPLHPKQANLMHLTGKRPNGIEKNEGKNIDFEIVKEYIDENTNQIQCYAKLIKEDKQ